MRVIIELIEIGFHANSMELCIIAHHAESAYHVAGLTNGDPSVRVQLTARGQANGMNPPRLLSQLSERLPDR